MKKRKCYANYTEFGKPYEAVCLLVNPENDFVNSTNVQMNKLQRNQQLQWFFEKHYNGMDILFLEGCFRVDAIYQYDLYKRVNETYEAEILPFFIYRLFCRRHSRRYSVGYILQSYI